MCLIMYVCTYRMLDVDVCLYVLYFLEIRKYIFFFGTPPHKKISTHGMIEPFSPTTYPPHTHTHTQHTHFHSFLTFLSILSIYLQL